MSRFVLLLEKVPDIINTQSYDVRVDSMAFLEWKIMDTEKFIGMRVMNTTTHAIGTIEYIRDGVVAIDFHGVTRRSMRCQTP